MMAVAMLNVVWMLLRVSEIALKMFNALHNVPCRYWPTSKRCGQAEVLDSRARSDGSELAKAAPMRTLLCPRALMIAQMSAGSSRRLMLWYEDAAFCSP
jgi:hypothetical protein